MSAGLGTPSPGIGNGAPYMKLGWGEDRPKTVLMIKKYKNKETTQFLSDMARQVVGHYAKAVH